MVYLTHLRFFMKVSFPIITKIPRRMVLCLVVAYQNHICTWSLWCIYGFGRKCIYGFGRLWPRIAPFFKGFQWFRETIIFNPAGPLNISMYFYACFFSVFSIKVCCMWSLTAMPLFLHVLSKSTPKELRLYCGFSLFPWWGLFHIIGDTGVRHDRINTWRKKKPLHIKGFGIFPLKTRCYDYCIWYWYWPITQPL